MATHWQTHQSPSGHTLTNAVTADVILKGGHCPDDGQEQSSVLGKWMESKDIGNAADVEQLFLALNNAVSQRDEALMVGHSYFMQEQAVDEKWFSNELLRFIWDYYIMPLIAEYECQSPRADLEKEYGLAALRESAN
jgi:hypothetical protein